MADIVAELERFVSLRGDTYSSAEVVGIASRAAAEIERLRGAVEQARVWFEGEGMHNQADGMSAFLEQKGDQK